MKDNHNNPIDERCLSSTDAHCEPSDPWGGAIDQRCTSIPKDERFRAGTTPEDDDYEPRRSIKDPESSPGQGPTRSDPLEKDSYYDDNGHLVLHEEDGATVKVIPERVDF